MAFTFKFFKPDTDYSVCIFIAFTFRYFKADTVPITFTSGIGNPEISIVSTYNVQTKQHIVR